MFSDKRYQEAAGIFLILCSIVLLLSIFSFDINDFDYLAGGKTVKNIMGTVGAYFGDFLRGAFGYSAYLLFVVFAVAGWRVLKSGTAVDVLERTLSLFLLMLTSSIFFAMLNGEAAPHFSGGYVGLFLSKLMVSVFSSTGAYIITGILNFIALILLGIISFAAILEFAGRNDRIPEFLKSLSQRMLPGRISQDIPLNNIEEDLNRRGKKPPWITKKRVVVNAFFKKVRQVPAETKQIEFMEKSRDRSVRIDKIISPRLDENPLFAIVPVARIKEPASGVQDAVFEYEDERERSAGVVAIEEASLYEDAVPRSESGLPLAKVRDHFVFGPNGEDFSGEVDYDDIVNIRDDILHKIETNRIRATEPGEMAGTSVIVEDYDDDSDDYHDHEEYDNHDDFDDDAVEAPAEDQDEDIDDDNTEDNPGFDDDESEQGSLFSENSYPRPERVFHRFNLPRGYSIPFEFLDLSKSFDAESWKIEAKRTSDLLVRMLNEFGIEARIVNINRGPVLTLYEIQIAPGIKVNRVVGLSDDIAMALAASRVRVVAPIPGKSAIGIEVPNTQREMVTLGDVVKAPEYKSKTGNLKVALGKDILGVPITIDLKKLPHLLIAGATGSGKSVCVNSIITSLLYNYDPNQVRFILVDPKMVELQLYNGMPHLITPVITENHVAPRALKWAMLEMERRYRLLSEQKARDIDKYNAKIAGMGEKYERLPYIVIIIDELADLMMIAAKEVEGFITRIAQKARAVGIHLVLATQRPSVNIITGVIKANFPARIAFQTAQKIDSRTIIDQNGAEKLLGKGDMLYQSPTNSFPIRVQGAFISEEEIANMVGYLKGVGTPSYIEFEDSIFEDDDEDDGIDAEEEDRLFAEAFKIIEETKKASASYLQRRLSIGYNRAARIIEMMEDRGYVGPQQGSKAREVFI